MFRVSFDLPIHFFSPEGVIIWNESSTVGEGETNLSPTIAGIATPLRGLLTLLWPFRMLSFVNSTDV